MKTKSKTPTKTQPVKPLGYVVRYEHGGSDGGLSSPLKYDSHVAFVNENAKALMIPDSMEGGTIFSDRTFAVIAVVESKLIQRSHGYNWNKMYGPYVITPVYL